MLQYFAENKPTDSPKFTPEDFIFRWKKIQRIIEKEGLDGLLLVTGIDGAQHSHTSYLFNWLFLGISGQNIFINRYLDPIYSEIIVFISSKASFIFITPQAKQKLDTLIYTIQNCTIFCPTVEEFNSKDKFQILKIALFYSKVSKFQKIGFFLEPQQPTKIIQKWPIIQSFALEPVGRTFFTLKFQTQNLNSKITQLFKNLDKNSLQSLIYQSAYSLEGQLRGSTQIIQYTKNKEKVNITQLKLQEPLFQSADINKQSNKTSQIRVLFGARTGRRQQKSKDISIKDSFAYHLTVEHSDPSSKLVIWRTYFLDTNKQFTRTVSLAQQQQADSFITNKIYKINVLPNHNFQKRHLLINTYLSLIQALIETISTVSKDYRHLNLEFFNTNILSKLNQLQNSNHSSPFLKQHLYIQLESFDSMGQPRAIDLKDSVSFKLSSTYYVVKCRINDIVFKQTGQLLGSVCFSEAFLLQEGCFLLLTKSSPYFQFWKTSNEENLSLQNLNPNLQFTELGPCLTSQFKNRMFIPLQKLSYFHFNIPVLNISYYLHEKGIRLFNEKIGWHLILYEQIQEASMINKINGQWVLFRLQKAVLFDGLENNLIAIQFRGKAFDHLLQKVNDKNNPLSLTFIDIIPSVLSQNWYFTQQILKRDVRDGAIIHQHQILQHDFLWSFIEAKQLMILNQMKDIKLSAFKQLYQLKVERKNQVLEPTQKKQVIIINGGYASNKLKLSQTLAKFGQQNRKYPVFRISSENLYAKISPNTFLEMFQEFANDVEQPQQSYIIAIIPSWLNFSETLPLFADKYHIRSVVTKINASNFFSNKNASLNQNALTFAVPGFSQSIVIDCDAEEEKLIGSITNILWAFNRQARIMRSSNGMLSTGQCLDICRDNAFNTEAHKFLRSKYGSLYKFDQLASLSVNFIEFKYPMIHLERLKELAEQEGFLVNLLDIQKQLQNKKLEAEQSKDELMEGLYRLQELVTINKKRQKGVQIRLLKGVLVKQDGSKYEMIWSNKVFKLSEVGPQRSLGIFILSKNYDELQTKNYLLDLTYKKNLNQKRKALRTKQSLNEQEKVTIGKGGRGKYLQNGQFYDGYFFRDVQGHILEGHPNLQRLVRDYIQTCNQEIHTENDILSKEWEQYCRKYD